MKTYWVRYERDEAGWWVATVDGVDGCMTQGKSLAQAETRIREALGLFIGEAKAAKATLELSVLLPSDLTALRDEARAAEKLAREAAEASRESAKRAAVAFTAAGYSTRDIGKLFGVSAQRVSQRTAAAPVKTKGRSVRGKRAA